ncbi:YoaK family protein [Chryseobacterium sp.]|uniref:YoaK family protein n=1 Tax=Chryseobacterium sp. TaxID=1871047 RepID=UPI0028999DCB|nr:YoaK family protein [Chryseobacterium sp.]
MKRDAIFYSSIIMAFCAGFVDTSTFTVADGLFSAHITGNLVVFAYKLSNHAQITDFINLLSFPVFIAAVMLTGKISTKFNDQKKITGSIGILLIISGMLAFFLKEYNISSGFLYHGMLMMIVFAMGIHNSVNRLYSGSVFGPTTVMTGNITKAVIDFFLYHSTQHTSQKLLEIKQSLVLLSGFLGGCISGALISHRCGLVSMLIPGILLATYNWVAIKKNAVLNLS